MSRSHKYISRKWQNGKWIYEYANPQITTGGWNNGNKDNQHYRSISNKKGYEITAVSGANKRNKYVGITFGKHRNKYKYVDKTAKIGRYTINYNNDSGMHNITLHKDHSKGKTSVQKYFSKQYKSAIKYSNKGYDTAKKFMKKYFK